MIYSDRCPKCGYLIDAATSIGKSPDDLPDPDDYSICLNCGALLEFDDKLRLHVVRDPQSALDNLPRDMREKVHKAQLYIWLRGRLR
jgi:hypothetical protein